MSLKKTYIQYGVPSDWAEIFEQFGISATTFKITSKSNLIKKYNIQADQIDFVKECLKRQPINDQTVSKLLENSRFVCCLCKGQKSDAYIVHHITEYSLSQDNSYENLAVLCPNDHDLAHRKGISLTSKISEEQIRQAKINWEQKVKKENDRILSYQIGKKEIDEFNLINPFKELQSFNENDQNVFFGRTIEIKELIEKIRKYNIVGLFGESGAGKTSLINAGLIPDFKKEGFNIIPIRCLDEPIKRIRDCLFKKLVELNVSEEDINKLFGTDSFAHLIIQLKDIIQKQNLQLIIIVDQFEEIFTRSRATEKEQFAKGVTEILINQIFNGKLYLLLSLREDFIGDLWDWAHLNKLEDAWVHQYRIGRLNEDKTYNAITQPLKYLNIKYEESFVRKLISELKLIGDGQIYPPYLQIVCNKLFNSLINQSKSNGTIIFNQNLTHDENCEETIANYLS
jgi:hypothetical protein